MAIADYFSTRRALRDRVTALEAELTVTEARCADECERVRARAAEETAFAREMLRAAMLKGGMYPPARTEAPQQPPAPAFELPVPLWVAAAEARAAEDREYDEAFEAAKAAAEAAKAAARQT